MINFSKNQGFSVFTLVGIIALALILVGTALFFVERSNNKGPVSDFVPDLGNASSTPIAVGTFKTVADALATNKDIVCEIGGTVNAPIGGGATISSDAHAIYYFSGGNIRSEIRTTAGSLYTIITPKEIYAWDSNKREVLSESSRKVESSHDAILKTDLSRYSCREQALPPALFEPPL